MSGVRKTSTTSAPRGAPYDIARSRGGVATTEPSKIDRAGITPQARELSRAREAVESASEVRAARVAALRKQIQDGTYNPDPREVAKQILERGF
jgi:negative regulator of flagellin synthesis FlgM